MENVIKTTNDGGLNLLGGDVTITEGGKIQSNAGFRATANDWGDSFSGWAYGDYVAEHTISNYGGNYDASGGTYENLFTDDTNSPFTQTDADNRNWIVVNSGIFKGAKAEIDTYIDASNVILHAHGACWDEDLTDVNYKIYKAPQIIFGSCYGTHLHTGTAGAIHIESTGGAYVGETSMLHISGEFGADGVDLVHFHTNAQGYSNVDALQLFYITGNLQTGDRNQVIQIDIDESIATGGEITGFNIRTSATSNMTRRAMYVGTGFTTALQVAGSQSEDPGYGYEVSSGVVTDRVNSGGGGNDAFINPAVNVQLFDSVNDYILIGSDNTFEIIKGTLTIASSKNCQLLFYYSKAGNNWTLLPGVDDGSQGFTMSSFSISFPAPADWTKDDQAEVNGDITEAYYIKILRTYATNIPTLPTESFFKIYAESAGDTGMKVYGWGGIKLPVLSDDPVTLGLIAALEDGMIWFETGGVHIVRDSGTERVLSDVAP